MKKIINMCCDCASPGYPCRGSLCPNRHVEAHYCDRCDAELEEDEIHDAEGMELCEMCRDELYD